MEQRFLEDSILELALASFLPVEYADVLNFFLFVFLENSVYL